MTTIISNMFIVGGKRIYRIKKHKRLVPCIITDMEPIPVTVSSVDGMPSLVDGMPSLVDGMPSLVDGMPSLSKKTVLTEDLGKKFEYAICQLYEIPFIGKFKYEPDAKLFDRLSALKTAFPHKIEHTAQNGSQYDFTGVDNTNIKLSAKTTKKDGRVCPQVIGQPSRNKFVKHFMSESPIVSPIVSQVDLSVVELNEQIKSFIEQNIKQMLPKYWETTFDCPIIYYNQKTDKLLLVEKHTDVEWDSKIIEFSHIKKNKKWNESSTISIDNITIGEFQIHTKRNCIKFRWVFENLLARFSTSFGVIII